MTYDGDEFQEIPTESKIAEVAKSEVYKASIRFMNQWKQNLRDEGYVNTGEGVNSITVSPEAEGSDSYRIGSNKVQVAVAEFGRAPGSFPPPDAIAEWVNEQSGLPDRGDEDFDNAVFNISKHIAENGISGFSPGRTAFSDLEGEYEQSVAERLEDEG